MQEVLILLIRVGEEIVGDVVQSPGALSLWRMPSASCTRPIAPADAGTAREENRRRAVGRRDGSAAQQGQNVYQTLEPTEQATMRKIMLRMVSAEATWLGAASRWPTSITPPMKVHERTSSLNGWWRRGSSSRNRTPSSRPTTPRARLEDAARVDQCGGPRRADLVAAERTWTPTSTPGAVTPGCCGARTPTSPSRLAR